MRTTSRRFPLRAEFVVGTLLLAPSLQVSAGGIEIATLDRDGNPIAQVAVYALPAAGTTRPTAPAEAVMDQKDRAFVPHILVVSTGTAIRFPNSDAVSHHVYSFSPARSFELGLYKQGTVHAPLTFDVAGVVTLGCNIHDDMVGYILVVDTPHFTLTNAHGIAALDGLPPGQYTVHVWTPRTRPGDLPTPIEMTVADEPAKHTLRFTAKLYPPHASSETSLKWAIY